MKTEYIQLVNGQGEQYPEQFQIQGKGKTVYIKVYPVKYSVNSEVFLYAENAISVTVPSTVPEPFAARTQTTQTSAPGSPLYPVLVVIALGIAVMGIRKKFKRVVDHQFIRSKHLHPGAR